MKFKDTTKNHMMMMNDVEARRIKIIINKKKEEEEEKEEPLKFLKLLVVTKSLLYLIFHLFHLNTT